MISSLMRLERSLLLLLRTESKLSVSSQWRVVQGPVSWPACRPDSRTFGVGNIRLQQGGQTGKWCGVQCGSVEVLSSSDCGGICLNLAARPNSACRLGLSIPESHNY